ncbi:MAG: hypothetical protein WC483_00320 [Candidatus Paceibacterota bacterium]
MAEELKSRFISELREKRRLFSADGGGGEDAASLAILEDLELLERSLDGVPEDAFTTAYCQGVRQKHPALAANSLTEAVRGTAPAKATRHRTAPIQKCDECGSPLSDGVCSSCSKRHVGEMPAAAPKSKASGELIEKMQQFESDLNILLAITPAPPDVMMKKDAIVAALRGAGIDIRPNEPIPSDKVRSAFAAVKLRQHYIWCNPMVYVITGWRPRAFEPNERTYLRECYRRVVLAFFRRMNQIVDGKKQMSNLWSMQAIIKMIFISSPAFRDAHTDFYETLHQQGSGTEDKHCEVWNAMSGAEGWTFQ